MKSHPLIVSQLEALYGQPPAAVPAPPSLARRLGAWSQNQLQTLATWLAPSPQPRVVQKCDRTGQPFWSVYDPHVRSWYRFDSEQAVRIWLEDRYNRP